MKRGELKFLVYNSSAKTFAMQMTKTDTFLSVALAFAAGGFAYVWGDETLPAKRVPLVLLAFSCAGVAVGISALGILAPALTLFLLWFLSNGILVASDFTSWKDKAHPDVIEYFTNCLVRSRVTSIYTGCFLLGAGLAFRLVAHEAGGLSEAGRAWLGGIGLDGAAFLLMTAVLPLVVGLGKAGEASETIERSGFSNMFVYMTIAPLTAVFMLNPLLVPSLTGLDLHLEPNVLALASIVYVFNLMLAGTIILADIRCRDFRDMEGIRADSLRNVTRFSYVVVSLAPLVLVGYAIFLSLK